MEKEFFKNEQLNDNENINISDYGISEETQNKVNYFAEVPENDFFNRVEALKSRTPIIVETRLDAISLIELGFQALAIENFEKVSHFIKKIKSMKNKSRKCFIFMLNESGEAQRQQEIITRELDKSDDKIFYKTVNAYCEDENLSINDRLLKDRDSLKNEIALAVNSAEKIIRESSVYAIEILDSIRYIKPDTDKKVLTGIKEFDTITGGLSSGLHTIGGVSAIGKTSFCVQLADEFAKQGKHVLYFNFEMLNRDLVAKSVSRLMFVQQGLKAEQTNQGKRLIAKKYSDLFNYSARQSFSQKENAAFEEAVETYKQECASRIAYYDRNYKYKNRIVGIDEIKQIVDDFAKTQSSDFVLFVDYLQILASRIETQNERQAIDYCVAGLKDIAYTYRVPVILVSAVNRNSYKEQFDMQNFKSSGLIEYASDSVLGLQLAGLDYDQQGDKSETSRKARIYDVEQQAFEAKKSLENDVKMQLKVLKSRNGYQFDVSLNAKLGFGYFGSDESNNTDVNGKKSVTTKSANSTAKTTRSATKKTSVKASKSIITSDNTQDDDYDPFAF